MTEGHLTLNLGDDTARRNWVTPGADLPTVSSSLDPPHWTTLPLRTAESSVSSSTGSTLSLHRS